jgi:hypothetical protein
MPGLRGTYNAIRTASGTIEAAVARRLTMQLSWLCLTRQLMQKVMPLAMHPLRTGLKYNIEGIL